MKISKKHDQLLIYLSYPIMDMNGEPAYVNDLINSKPEQWLYYRPYDFNASQSNLYDRLNCYIPDKCKEKFKLTKQTYSLAETKDTVTDIVKDCEKFVPPSNGLSIVLKRLAILAVSDLVLVYGGAPNYGGSSMELLWANILNKYTIGITDRFLVSPWFQTYTEVIVKHNSILEELIYKTSLRYEKRSEFEFHVEDENKEDEENKEQS